MRDTYAHADMPSELMQKNTMTGLLISVIQKLSKLVPQQHPVTAVQVLPCCSLASTTQSCTAHFVSASKNTGQKVNRRQLGRKEKKVDQDKNQLTVKTERICAPSPSAAPSHPVNCTSPNTMPFVTAAAAARR